MYFVNPNLRRPSKWTRWNCIGDLQGSKWGERGKEAQEDSKWRYVIPTFTNLVMGWVIWTSFETCQTLMSLAWGSYNQNSEQWFGCRTDSKECTLLSTPNFKNGNEFGLDLSWLHFSRRWDKGKYRQQTIFESASKSTRDSFKSLEDKIQPPRKLHSQLQGRGIRLHQKDWDWFLPLLLQDLTWVGWNILHTGNIPIHF